ncbi:MAG: hypothetical protein IIZ78_00600 [Clostridiales bacterium]|nr:hypothetical protein [Clostridiales bacterium]
MSDYGFATYDKTGKKRTGSVNSKWPIFGPKYADIKRAFRTIHFTDTTQYDYRTSSSVVLPPAQRGGISQYHGYEKVLIATIPHGYKRRPLGYVTFSGSYVKNTRSKWVYTRTTDNTGQFPPSSTLQAVQVGTGTMISNVGAPILPTTATPSPGASFDDNYFGETLSYPTFPVAFLVDNHYQIPGNNTSQPDGALHYRPPYGAEIDDTNVYIYRYYYWSDVYKRDYYSYSGTVQFDVRARMSGIIDYAGSSFDATIYLCPYSMEDLV